jgi:hypothetical protein
LGGDLELNSSLLDGFKAQPLRWQIEEVTAERNGNSKPWFWLCLVRQGIPYLLSGPVPTSAVPWTWTIEPLRNGIGCSTRQSGKKGHI